MKKTMSIALVSFLLGIAVTCLGIRCFLAHAPGLAPLTLLNWMTASRNTTPDRFIVAMKTPHASVAKAGNLILTLSAAGDSLTLSRGQETHQLTAPRYTRWRDLKIAPDASVAFMLGREDSPTGNATDVNHSLINISLPKDDQGFDACILTSLPEGNFDKMFPGIVIFRIISVGIRGERVLLSVITDQGPEQPAFYYPIEKKLDILQP